MTDILALAERAAREAGAIARCRCETARVSEKSLNNLVTEADIEAERAIVAAIGRERPGDGIYAEECSGRHDLAADGLWLIDPIDGTTNYAHGLPHYAVSIAYARRGQVLVGVVYDPVRDEMFSAIRGGGARLNGRQMRVSGRGLLQESLISTGFHYHEPGMVRRTLAAIGELFGRNVREIRRLGSAALDLCWTACGRLDGFFEYQLQPWDFAAGTLIVAEAGGAISERSGRALVLTSPGVIASNGRIHDELLSTVRWEEA